ncbi:hypothetical protein [Reichenbachiella ulvae]|uniref:Calx-beta domain-containing protein n=1 Tax=Reichenbachiella ulvae TaxID=2980104 RepID=A0ABT3D009_9BACT|nr:hypothetical protein [Reichenbachiella ulvae]MCV9389292.1 hypothetical protein [Reichenbachiella ulvae]
MKRLEIMKKTVLPLCGMAVILGTIFSGCEEEGSQTKTIAKKQSVDFIEGETQVMENSTEGLEIALETSSAVSETGMVTVMAQSESLVYGEDYTTTPEAIDGVIFLELASGSNTASFVMNPKDNDVAEASKFISFEIQGATTGLEKGEMNAVQIEVINEDAGMTASVSSIDFGAINTAEDQYSGVMSFDVNIIDINSDIEVTATDQIVLSKAENGTYSSNLTIPISEFSDGMITLFAKGDSDGVTKSQDISGSIILSTADLDEDRVITTQVNVSIPCGGELDPMVIVDQAFEVADLCAWEVVDFGNNGLTIEEVAAVQSTVTNSSNGAVELKNSSNNYFGIKVDITDVIKCYPDATDYIYNMSFDLYFDPSASGDRTVETYFVIDGDASKKQYFTAGIAASDANKGKWESRSHWSNNIKPSEVTKIEWVFNSYGGTGEMAWYLDNVKMRSTQASICN